RPFSTSDDNGASHVSRLSDDFTRIGRGKDAPLPHCVRNASTSATPVAPFLPRTIVVYAPGGSVTRIADSVSASGARPVAWMAACCVDFQSSLVCMTVEP